MASTTSQTAVTSAPNALKLHLGQYKEIEATRVDREVEEGKTGEPAAKVIHLRDSGLHQEAQTLMRLSSTQTTYRLGTQIRSTPLWNLSSTKIRGRARTLRLPTYCPKRRK